MKFRPEIDSQLAKAQAGFQKHFGTPATLLSRAPGRLEILGNHTDYNQGTVLSVAVDRQMCIAAAPRRAGDGIDGMTCRLYDLNVDSSREFRLDALDDKRKGDWANYIKGLVCELNELGYSVPAFDAVLLGSVPLSAGMSSSAALEMAMVLVLNELSGAGLDWLQLAKVGQGCENHYVGAQTGLLDQFSSLKGRAGQLIYSDFRSYDVANVPMPAGSVFVVANSMVKHNLTNEYNERRQACEAVARALKVSALRDVTPQMLEAARASLDPVCFRRASHVVGEIDRVARGVKALEDGDIAAFGRLMSLSHRSSIENFENSCEEIDDLVALGSALPGFLGARISGGGFGGISVHLVQAEAAQEYARLLAEAYKAKRGIDSQVMICAAADGAAIYEA